MIETNGNRADWSPGTAPRPADEILATRTLQAARKTFTLSHRRNAAGEFVRVDEERNGRRATMIVGAEDVPEFLTLFQELAAGLADQS
jgi:hypothetical protein